MSLKRIILAAIPSLFFIATTSFATSIMHQDGLVPSGKGYGVPSVKALKVTAAGNGIDYHGGEVMGTAAGATPNFYVIYYGNWPANTGQSLIENFLRNIGPQPFYGILSTYYNASNQHVQKKATFVKSISDNYSQGKALSDSSISTIVSNAISSGKLPLDSNGVYFVLTSSDVTETSGFCSQYCGWHVADVYQNRAYIRVAFIGNASKQCPGGCMIQQTSPNNNAGVDAMINIIGHEMSESVTDPLGNAWYDTSGQENADKCNFNFGTTQKAPNGSKYNQVVGNTRYLVQQDWVNANGGYCAQGYT